MKSHNTQIQTLTNTRHRLISHIAKLAINQFLSDKEKESAQVALHTSDENAHSLVEALKDLDLKLVALCNGRTCRWNGNGIDMSNGSDQILDINIGDTYQLGTEVLIFDKVIEFIDESDAKSFKCKVIIETGKYLSKKAKKILIKKGIQIIPKEFFKDLDPKNNLKNELSTIEDSIDSSWKKTNAFARKNNLSFNDAFLRL